MDNELYHYGVKGMRWGVVRDRQKNWKFWKSDEITNET